MAGTNQGQLLRIFIGESDRHEGQPLFEWIVREARKQGLAGATCSHSNSERFNQPQHRVSRAANGRGTRTRPRLSASEAVKPRAAREVLIGEINRRQNRRGR